MSLDAAAVAVFSVFCRGGGGGGGDLGVMTKDVVAAPPEGPPVAVTTTFAPVRLEQPAPPRRPGLAAKNGNVFAGQPAQNNWH